MVLSSCANVGYIAGGKTKTFKGSYELPIYNSIEASKTRLKSILIVDGWNKTSENENTITFGNSASKGSQIGLGKYKMSQLNLVFDSEKITISIMQIGNFKYGTEEATNETFEKIKEKYNNKN